MIITERPALYLSLTYFFKEIDYKIGFGPPF